MENDFEKLKCKDTLVNPVLNFLSTTYSAEQRIGFCFLNLAMERRNRLDQETKF